MTEMTRKPEDTLTKFLEAEREWINSIIETYPQQIPVNPIAEHWGCEASSVRAAIEQSPTFGVFWKKVGGVNKKYLIPTGLFVLWYCKVRLV